MNTQMKLRNYLYLNSKVVEDYISAIDGYSYDEETQLIATSKENNMEGKGALGFVSGNGSHTGRKSEEVKRSVHISDSAKFEKIYRYLQDEEGGLKCYYDSISETEYNNLFRDDFLEVLVTARFSKMKELTESVKKISELATLFETITSKQILDKKTAEAVNGLSALGSIRSGKEISCVFEFKDGNHPLVAYLDESYFRCKQDNFVGQAYMLCKIIRKLPKGKSIKLDEIFDDIKKIPLNRTQRRKNPKNFDNPAELRDIINGPALIVLPIAVYQ